MSQFDEMADERYRSLGKVLVTPQQAKIAELFGSMEGIRLAAAAPKLLAALEAVTEYAEEVTRRVRAGEMIAAYLQTNVGKIETARAAIAEAKREAL